MHPSDLSPQLEWWASMLDTRSMRDHEYLFPASIETQQKSETLDQDPRRESLSLANEPSSRQLKAVSYLSVKNQNITSGTVLYQITGPIRYMV